MKMELMLMIINAIALIYGLCVAYKTHKKINALENDLTVKVNDIIVGLKDAQVRNKRVFSEKFPERQPLRDTTTYVNRV